MFKLVLEKAEEPEIKLPKSAGSLKNKRVSEKHLLLHYWLCQSLWLCGSQETVKNSSSWLRHYVNCELPDVQAGFSKGRRTRDKIANIHWIKKAREFQKNIYFCFIDYAKAFNCVDHNKVWKILKEMGIPDHLTCLLRNLYADQEAAIKTGHGTSDWFQIGKGLH